MEEKRKGKTGLKILITFYIIFISIFSLYISALLSTIASEYGLSSGLATLCVGLPTWLLVVIGFSMVFFMLLWKHYHYRESTYRELLRDLITEWKEEREAEDDRDGS